MTWDAQERTPYREQVREDGAALILSRRSATPSPGHGAQHHTSEVPAAVCSHCEDGFCGRSSSNVCADVLTTLHRDGGVLLSRYRRGRRALDRFHIWQVEYHGCPGQQDIVVVLASLTGWE
jgi:hypothetical protein